MLFEVPDGGGEDCRALASEPDEAVAGSTEDRSDSSRGVAVIDAGSRVVEVDRGRADRTSVLLGEEHLGDLLWGQPVLPLEASSTSRETTQSSRRWSGIREAAFVSLFRPRRHRLHVLWVAAEVVTAEVVDHPASAQTPVALLVGEDVRVSDSVTALSGLPSPGPTVIRSRFTDRLFWHVRLLAREIFPRENARHTPGAKGISAPIHQGMRRGAYKVGVQVGGGR